MATDRKQSHFPLYTPGFRPLHDKDITRERLAAEMAAFDKAGGKIEVLGITPLRRKLPKDEAPDKTAAPAAASKGDGKRR